MKEKLEQNTEILRALGFSRHANQPSWFMVCRGIAVISDREMAQQEPEQLKQLIILRLENTISQLQGDLESAIAKVKSGERITRQHYGSKWEE